MDAEPSLINGYVQVEDFQNDEEYEDIDGEIVEEVEYVTLDLGSIEPTLVPSSSSFRLIGLDSPTPFLQLSGTVFKGEHQTLLGTELLFTDSKGTSGARLLLFQLVLQRSEDDQGERNKKTLTHVANTERRIRFKEVELQTKNQTNKHPISGSYPSEAVNIPPKKRITGTVEELVGSEATQAPRGRGKRGRGKSTKGKGRGQTEQSGVEAMDTTEG
ncbi:hypothetical protein BDY19DRAFT_909230 [Irpex rosettiformis]|uniref:Uncharacterized protein n=1 Tax=Irpex rosettiformis TaxID=378272 RepID=A0ACB8TT64_9APHY|nr:hypothetical protein BDY19DRAFT_909230 [Irpex rosettiformis]